MTDSEINVTELISDEQLEKLGFTREAFEESNVKILLESMLFGFEETLKEETQKLMKEHSLSYGEARSIAFNRVFGAVANGMKGGYGNGDKK